jgi:hypothetical protein
MITEEEFKRIAAIESRLDAIDRALSENSIQLKPSEDELMAIIRESYKQTMGR